MKHTICPPFLGLAVLAVLVGLAGCAESPAADRSQPVSDSAVVPATGTPADTAILVAEPPEDVMAPLIIRGTRPRVPSAVSVVPENAAQPGASLLPGAGAHLQN